MDCLISFSDFLYAFQAQFYYEGENSKLKHLTKNVIEYEISREVSLWKIHSFCNRIPQSVRGCVQINNRRTADTKGNGCCSDIRSHTKTTGNILYTV